MVQGLGNFFANAGKALVASAGLTVAEAAATIAKNAADSVDSATSTTASAVITDSKKTTSFLDKATDLIGDVITGTAGLIAPIIGHATQGVRQFQGDVGEAILSTASDVVHTVQTVVDKIGTFIWEIVNNVTIALGSAFDFAMEALADMPTLFEKAFMVNLDNYVDDGMKYYKLTKDLAERILKEEKEAK